MDLDSFRLNAEYRLQIKGLCANILSGQRCCYCVDGACKMLRRAFGRCQMRTIPRWSDLQAAVTDRAEGRGGEGEVLVGIELRRAHLEPAGFTHEEQQAAYRPPK